MIVATQAFILAAAAVSPPLYNPRILWRNRIADLPAASITVSGETATGPRDATTRPNTDEYWEPDTLPAWILYDLGSAYTINGVGIGGHNFGTRGTAVKVEVGTDPAFAADAIFAEERVPDDDSALLLLDDDTIGRYVKISLTGSVTPRMSVAAAGDVLAMEKEVAKPYAPISMARKTMMSGRLSRGGQFLGQGMRSHGLEADVSFERLSGAWVRANFNAFSKHARSKPYFFAWNPLDLPREVGYVWTVEKDIVPVHNGSGLSMDVAWSMVGIGHE